MLTFFFVNIFWIFFRATTLQRAWDIVKSMFDILHINGTTKEFRRVMSSFDIPRDLLFGILIGAAIIAFLLPNSAKWKDFFQKHPYCRIIATALFFFIGFICLSRKSPFLYFNF
jgi:D-alanyl-lipoteichoic acid acyltransferase DltB (MBOAT superfamily)